MRLTKDQRKALHKVWKRTVFGQPNPLTYRQFRRTVQPGFPASDPVAMVPWCGMWLGIEPDGHVHS